MGKKFKKTLNFFDIVSIVNLYSLSRHVDECLNLKIFTNKEKRHGDNNVS